MTFLVRSYLTRAAALFLLPLLLCDASSSTQDAAAEAAAAAAGLGRNSKNGENSAECALSEDGTCRNSNDEEGAAGGGAAAEGTTSQDHRPAPLECGLYMAPSTLGEDTNMGMYAGKAYSNQEVLNYPEIAIPLLFREWGEHREGFSDGELWDRYIWEGSVASLEPYTDTNREDSRAVFVPGIGCTINSIMDMNNIESTTGSLYDTAGLHRKKDPGAGAFSPYHSSNTTAVIDIPPGAEIFASYGDYWIPDIKGAQITLDDNMEAAEDFLRNEYYPWIKEHGDKLDEDTKQALWQYTTKDFPLYSKVFTVLPTVPWKDVEAALEKHKAPVFSVIKKFIREQSVRTIDWLNEHGYCQDHIKPGISTLPQAGRGAFASRDLPKGTVVAYSPLIHMGEYGRELYMIDYRKQLKGKKADKGNMSRGKQYDLIINYSFGHSNSSVLLTPYGQGVNYINHGGKEKANVKVRWPSRELIAHKPDWLLKTPEQLRNTLEKIGLSFEYVALRDIEQGEEIFLDYGPEWQQAWDDHVASWQPLSGAENYLHSSEWHEDFIRTKAELKKDPYPENFVTLCIESYTQDEEGLYFYLPPLAETAQRVYCRVLKRTVGDDDSPLYTVEMDVPGQAQPLLVQDVDSDGIFLYNRAFSADWHMPNAFRHEIMIPDDVIPEAWLNGPGYNPLEDSEDDDDDDDDDDGEEESEDDEGEIVEDEE